VVYFKNKAPPHVKDKEVVQAKFLEEYTKMTQELNMKVRRLPRPSSLPPNPMKIGVSFLWDTLGLLKLTPKSEWFRFDSTFFLYFQAQEDRLHALWAKQNLLFLPHRIFLDVNLTRS
jgi:hypothetical protein